MPKFGEKNQNINADNITAGTLGADRLPIATGSTPGAIKVGSGFTISNGFLNNAVGATSGTFLNSGVSVSSINGETGSILATAITRKDPSAAVYTQGGPQVNRQPLLVDGNKFYLTAGSGNGNMSIFDTVGNSWTTSGGIQGRNGPCAVAYSGKFYYFGGVSNTPAVTNTTQEFTVAGATNNAGKATMTTARWLATAVLVGDKAYVMGGATDTAGTGTAIQANEMYDITNNTWTTKANMPTARREHMAAAVGTIIYVFGGSDSSGTPLTTVEAYDTVNDTWSTKASIPFASKHGCIFVNGNYIHIVGGETSTGYPTNRHYAYNTTNDTWEARTNAKTVFYAANACVIGTKAYMGFGSWIFSNINGSKYATTSSGEIVDYNLSTDLFSGHLELPTVQASIAEFPKAFVVGSKVFVLGGQWASDAGVSANAVQLHMYDFSTQIWYPMYNYLPYIAFEFGGAVVGDKIYIISGKNVFNINGNTVTSNVYMYDTVANTFTQKANITTPRAAFACEAIGTKIYCVGGLEAGGIISSLNEAYDTVANTWESKASITGGTRYRAGSGTNGTNMWVFGGWVNNVISNDNRMYDPVANTWTSKTAITSITPNGPACAVHDGLLYSCGGQNGSGTNYSDTYAYDFVANTWAFKANMPFYKYWGTAFSYNGTLYALGGNTGGVTNRAFFSFVGKAVPATVNTHGLAMHYNGTSITNRTSGVTGTIIPVKSGDLVTLYSDQNTWAALNRTDQMIIS